MYSTNFKLMAYVCHLCNKEYQRERCFRSHVAICEFRERSKKERDEEITCIEELPSKKDLFIQIVFLTKELEKMKSELEIVKRTQGVKKNKISIISWLNNNYKPDFSLTELIKKIEITEKDFVKLQEYKTKNVYADIIKRILTENADKKLPICAFPQSIDTLYVYTNKTDKTERFISIDKPNVWTNISEIFIQSIISNIEQKMLDYFKNWETKMGDKIYNSEEVSEEYSNYVTAIIGKSNKDIITEITRYMKPQLYQTLKSKRIDMAVTEIND